MRFVSPPTATTSIKSDFMRLYAADNKSAICSVTSQSICLATASPLSYASNTIGAKDAIAAFPQE